MKRLGPDEFDKFIEQALALRARPRSATLSAAETRLLKRINRGLPEDCCRRYAQLVRKREKGSLTGAEHAELLKLTRTAESRDAERAAALWELAQLRRVPLRTLVKQLGIKARPIDG
ncbi:MAG: hypothetical protein L0Y71_01835 [Gemmataceae bacterium]|nr:hypothetical protein [Gemmataceae bacterium]